MRGNLFLCVANSARSQMAEVARAVAPRGVTVWSAGSSPACVRPEAVTVMREIGIDISGQRAKSIAEIPADEIDTVVTLCGGNACPILLGSARYFHWGIPDPAAVEGREAIRLVAFLSARDELRRRTAELVAAELRGERPSNS
ncbi:MAG: arsenate reductase ArsC [Candidatus Bipolaricaulota bacterium]|nr:arsenate reductase ArsC [Candidatus Bipolaricaulota bacterium]